MSRRQQRSKRTGTLIRETRPDPIPDGWTVFEDTKGEYGRRGEWRARGSKAHCGARCYKVNRTRDRLLVPVGPWIARWFDHDGLRKEHSTGTTDHAAAERILNKLVTDAALRRDGVIDARSDRYAAADRVLLSKHVDEWEASLRARNRTERHVRQQVARVRELLDQMHVERLSGITLSGVQTALNELRGQKLTWKTLNYYAQAVGQFMRWCRRDRRIPENPLDGFVRAQTASDDQYVRRALEADELRLLVSTTQNGPASEELTGPERAILYQVAAGTGFRVSELHSLIPLNFRLDDDPPSIVLGAANSKHRHEDVQPIRDDLAALLRDWLANRPADQPLWPGNWKKHGARMIRTDIRRARARWIRATRDRQQRRKRRDSDFLAETDAAGRVVDFHALRATYITLLVKSGASIKVVQELARHSDPKLTMNIYTKLGVHDLSAALDRLPKLPSPPQPERLRATGTDNASAGNPADPHLFPHQLGRETQQPGAAGRTDAPNVGTADATRNSFSATDIRDHARNGAAEGGKGGDGIRTHEKRICNPLP